MNYCAASDIRLYVPQAPAAETFAGWITDAGGIIDAHLRGSFVVPLYAGVEGDVEQYVTTMAAKLAGGLYLRAKMSQKSKDPHPGAERLIEEGMQMLADVKADKSLIDSELKSVGTSLDSELSVYVAGDDLAPVFGRGDERTWE